MFEWIQLQIHCIFEILCDSCMHCNIWKDEITSSSSSDEQREWFEIQDEKIQKDHF